MRHNIPTLIRRLEDLNRQLKATTKSRQIKQAEKEVQSIYDELCAVYPTATFEERVDISIALEYRDMLLEIFVDYFRNIADQAFKAAQRKRKQALELIEHAVAADAIIGRKVVEGDLESANDRLIEAAENMQVDILELAREMEVPYKYYVQRAIQYNKGHDRVRALKALGIALKLHPSLENNDRVIALAVTLTGETAQSAMITVGEGYVLKKLVHQLEEEQLRRQYLERPKPRTTLDTIRSLFSSDPQ